MRIIYVTARLPHGTDEAFIIPEICQLVRAGHEVLVIPRSPRGAILHGAELLEQSFREAIFSPGVAEKGPVAGIGPWLVASLVWGIGLSLGGTTGYAINPARDLGPRLAHALLPIPGKGDSNWGYAPIPVIGPLLGAALAGVFLKFTHPW